MRMNRNEFVNISEVEGQHTRRTPVNDGVLEGER